VQTCALPIYAYFSAFETNSFIINPQGIDKSKFNDTLLISSFNSINSLLTRYECTKFLDKFTTYSEKFICEKSFVWYKLSWINAIDLILFWLSFNMVSIFSS